MTTTVILTTANPKALVHVKHQDHVEFDKWARKPGAIFAIESLPFQDGKSVWQKAARVSLQYKQRRVVLEAQQDGATITVQNMDPRHSVRVQPVDKKSKNPPVVGYVPPGQMLDVWVGDGKRVILDEVPT
jgi:hypothetical protein